MIDNIERNQKNRMGLLKLHHNFEGYRPGEKPDVSVLICRIKFAKFDNPAVFIMLMVAERLSPSIKFQ